VKYFIRVDLTISYKKVYLDFTQLDFQTLVSIINGRSSDQNSHL